MRAKRSDAVTSRRVTPEQTEAVLLSPPQAAARYALGSSQLKRLRRRRVVRFVKIGHRSVLYDSRSLARFLESRAFEALPIVGGEEAGCHE